MIFVFAIYLQYIKYMFAIVRNDLYTYNLLFLIYLHILCEIDIDKYL